MTTDKIRIAVAKCLGHKIFTHGVHFANAEEVSCRGTTNVIDMLLNYPASLDACAEFEKMLIGTDRYTYMNHLRTIVGRRCEKNKVGTALVSDFDCKTALAIECCEAYLRVKGKWPSE